MIHVTDSKTIRRNFPGGLVVKTLPSSTGDVGSTSSPGTKIPHASYPKEQPKI